MSQFGMQMPGGRTSKGAGPDVYTALMFVAVVALGVAVGVVWVAGGTVGPEGSPIELHDQNGVRLSTSQ